MGVGVDRAPKSWRDSNINLGNSSFETDMRVVTRRDLVAGEWGEV